MGKKHKDLTKNDHKKYAATGHLVNVAADIADVAKNSGDGSDVISAAEFSERLREYDRISKAIEAGDAKEEKGKGDPGEAPKGYKVHGKAHLGSGIIDFGDGEPTVAETVIGTTLLGLALAGVAAVAIVGLKGYKAVRRFVG